MPLNKSISRFKDFAEIISNKLKQFGLYYTFLRFINWCIKPIYNVKGVVIMAIPEHKPAHFDEKIHHVCKITHNLSDQVFSRGEIREKVKTKIQQFLKEGSIGYFIMFENKIAGFAFIQNNGIYHFCKRGRFNIPYNMSVLKNLYIYPKYRGKSLGQILNNVRISNIPTGRIPLGFVVKDNKYAIRNLAKVGFVKIITIRVVTYFGSHAKQSIQKTHIESKEKRAYELIEELKKGLCT